MELALKLIREAKEQRLTRLDLGKCGLTELPNELFELTWLEELILGSSWTEYSFEKKGREFLESQNYGTNNNIKFINQNIHKLSELKKVIVFGWIEKYDLSDLSPLKNLIKLQELYVNETLVSDLSPLKELTNLHSLSVGNTLIVDLNMLENLVKLHYVDVSENNVKDLNPLKNLHNLRILDISETKVSNLGTLKYFSNLQRLYVSKTKVSNLNTLKDLINLQSLDISNTKVSDLRPLEKLTNLKSVWAHNTLVQDLKTLKKLPKLESLSLAYNPHIFDLNFLKDLTELQTLHIQSLEINDLSALENLVNLKHLAVENTLVKNLYSLEKLKNLVSLRINNTPVSDLTPLKELTKLQVLQVSETQVTDLSPLKKIIEKGIEVKWSDDWYTRDGIYVKDCPLTNPPKEIVEQGNDAILNYWKQIEEQGGTIPLFEAKLIMVGEPGAGKTSLTEKLLDEKHKVTIDDPKKKSTLGINIHENWRFDDCKRQGELFTSHIWDFGGQEIQYMTHQFFLTPESLYVLVADDRKQHTLFPYWFEIIHLLGKDDGGRYSPIVVVLNERNHKSITNFDINEYRNKYPDTRIDVLEVDLGDENLERFRVVRDKIQQSLCYLDHIGRPLPRMWPRIREAILELNNTRNHINETEFAEICARFKVTQKEDRQLISKYLHHLGIILHFQSDLQLRDFIIISPKWALKAVYAVLEDKEVAKRFGRFTEADLDIYWEDLTSDERSKILSLMKKDNFEICYSIGNSTYIAPQLLPQIRPEFQWNSKESLKCHFFYRFMPKGIMTRLIVRKPEFLANDGRVWARGAVFQRFDCDILVTEEETERNGLIAIEVNGKEINKIRALDFIRNEIEEIHRKWFSNITYEERAPCNCENCRNSTKPTFHNWKTLIQCLEQNIETIQCFNIIVKNVPILPLVEGFASKERIVHSLFNKSLNKGGAYNYISQEEREFMVEKVLEKPSIRAPSVSLPKIEEKNIEQPKNVVDKMKEYKWLITVFLIIAFMIWFFKCTSSGSKFSFGGASGEQGGKETPKIQEPQQKAKECDVQGLLKINNEIPRANDIDYIYAHHAPDIKATLLSGGMFYLTKIPIPTTEKIIIDVVLKNNRTPISAIVPFNDPVKNLSIIPEILFEGEYDSKKQLKSIVFKNYVDVKVQQAVQSGNGNTSTQK